MRVPTHPTLIRRMIDARVGKLTAQGPVLSASLVTIAKHCGRPGCHCQTGDKHVGNYVTFAIRGKTKTIYVPLDLVEEVRAWVTEQKRLKQLIREISALSVALIRGHAQDRKRRGGRSQGSGDRRS